MVCTEMATHVALRGLRPPIGLLLGYGTLVSQSILQRGSQKRLLRGTRTIAGLVSHELVGLFLTLAAFLPAGRDGPRFNPAAFVLRAAAPRCKSFRIRAAGLLGGGGGLYRTIAAVMPGHRFMMLGDRRGNLTITRCRMLRLNLFRRDRYRPGAEHEHEENRQNPRPSCASLNHESILAHSRFACL